MNRVFEKTSVAGMVFENRILRSATHEGLGDEDGHTRKELLSLYEKLAKSNVGAIITGYVGIQKNGRLLKNMCMFDNDEYIDEHKELILKISDYGTPIILQLAHGGGTCSPQVTGEAAVAPSAIKRRDYPTKPRELSDYEIEQIISNFVKAIERAKQAGFAGVQLHAAHGYLLSQFLSPHFNKRKDRWGGSTKNRFRIIAMIMEKARQKVDDYPILVKMSASDGCKNGMRIDEGIRIAQRLQKSGCNAIEVSCGGGDGFNCVRVSKIPMKAAFKLVPWFKNMHPLKKKISTLMAPFIFKKYRPLYNYNVEAAIRIKEHVTIPVIVVGGIRRIGDIEKVINKNEADYVSMSRPFIIEPNIVAKFLSGEQDASRCINCGYCLLGVAAKPLKCYYGRLPK